MNQIPYTYTFNIACKTKKKYKETERISTNISSRWSVVIQCVYFHCNCLLSREFVCKFYEHLKEKKISLFSSWFSYYNFFLFYFSFVLGTLFSFYLSVLCMGAGFKVCLVLFCRVLKLLIKHRYLAKIYIFLFDMQQTLSLQHTKKISDLKKKKIFKKQTTEKK